MIYVPARVRRVTYVPPTAAAKAWATVICDAVKQVTDDVTAIPPTFAEIEYVRQRFERAGARLRAALDQCLQQRIARDYLVTGEAATICCVHPNTIGIWCRQGLPYTRLSPRRRRIKKADLRDWLLRRGLPVPSCL